MPEKKPRLTPAQLRVLSFPTDRTLGGKVIVGGAMQTIEKLRALGFVDGYPSETGYLPAYAYRTDAGAARINRIN